ncbi:hypothetical protein CERZMDRAFT_90854 [Cercospora zeae-maydis SCOH1-5]|uniref:Uncharacterized protein n=1 Tax=Cercospora zeae-maydis SCOH1-5 TaxID=717836 RepID=A0A6A6FE52_9PEZI|nr:hypothetical protein CERZMDRAFT_90854 [Cercospora zeae-maydis SCOH1-5]
MFVHPELLIPDRKRYERLAFRNTGMLLSLPSALADFSSSLMSFAMSQQPRRPAISDAVA